MIKHFDHQHSTVQEVRVCGHRTTPKGTENWADDSQANEAWAWAQQVASVDPDGILSTSPKRPFSLGYAMAEAALVASRSGGEQKQVWLQDVENGDATWEEYVDARTDLPEETRQQVKARSAKMAGPAPTQKQIDYLISLAAQKGVEVDPESFTKHTISAEIDRLRQLPKAAPALQAGKVDGITKEAIKSKRIESLMDSGVPVQYVTQDGIYRNPATGEIFKVQWNRASGNGRSLYAKQLFIETWTPEEGEKHDPVIPLDTVVVIDDGHEPIMIWKYVPGLLRKVHPEWRMTSEDSTAFGQLYGVCVRCFRDLTNEVSIDRGMGPICAGKQFA